METRTTAALRALVSAAAAAVWAATPADAQRLLDLEPRPGAASEAIAEGALAVFWNPGGLAAVRGRAEASVVDVRGPESTGLGGLALAAVLRIDPRTTVGLGFQHAGIEGIERTTDSPLPQDARGAIDLGEQTFTAAAARDLDDALSLGVSIHYVRAADVEQVSDAVDFGAGVRFRPALPLAPVVGIATHVEADEVLWRAGVEVEPFVLPGGDWAIRAGYGAAAGGRVTGTGHRVTTSARFRDRAAVALGVAGGGAGDDFGWTPVASAELRLARYVVAVLRESLPNDFGAVHAFRFTVRF